MSNGAPNFSYRCCTLQRQYTENSKQVFPEMKLRGPSANSYFMFLLAIYIYSHNRSAYSLQKNKRTDRGNI
jgi:hypothetical protein